MPDAFPRRPLKTRRLTMVLRSLLVSSVVAAALAAGPASAFMAQNDFTVRTLEGGRFEVRPRGQLSATDAWCAAGDYAIRLLNVPRGTQIWRISEPPRRSGQSIVFSLSSEGAASSTGLVNLGGSGASMSASHAQSLCAASRNNRRLR
jgi:hypothetical protein